MPLSYQAPAPQSCEGNARLIGWVECLSRPGFDQLLHGPLQALNRCLELWHCKRGEQFFAICKRVVVDV